VILLLEVAVPPQIPARFIACSLSLGRSNPVPRNGQDFPHSEIVSMKKLFALVLCCAGVLSLFSLGARQADAIPAFNKEFQDLYFKKDSTDPKEKALADKIEKTKCNVCHVGTKKKDRNAYGQELDKLLDKKEDIKNPTKIQEALKKVAEMPSDPANPQSPSFGQRMKDGDLP
jgi:hypothetical protein